jgi:hypothetical protein
MKVVMKVMQLTAGTAIVMSVEAKRTLFQMDAHQLIIRGRTKAQFVNMRLILGQAPSSSSLLSFSED